MLDVQGRIGIKKSGTAATRLNLESGQQLQMSRRREVI